MDAPRNGDSTTAESTPELWKNERTEQNADQWRMRGVIVVARGDHCRGAIVLDTIRILIGHAGAIAGKHSAPAPRQMPRKRKPQQTRARDLSNVRKCSLRCELLTAVARYARNFWKIAKDQQLVRLGVIKTKSSPLHREQENAPKNNGKVSAQPPTFFWRSAACLFQRAQQSVRIQATG